MAITSISIIKKLTLLFLVVGGLIIAKPFLMPLFIGGILATLFLPFCNWMEKKRLTKGLAVFICFITLLIIISGIVLILGFKVAELLTDVAILKQKATALIEHIQGYIFNHLGISIAKQSQILEDEQPSVGGIMQTLVSSVSGILANMSLVFIYFLFLLFYRIHLKHFFLKLVKPEQRNITEPLIGSVAKVSQQYMLGMFKMIACLWVLYGIGFSVLGVQNAIFFAILCGLLEIVPYVGNLTGSALTLLVAALHDASPSVLGGIVLVYATIQIFQGWVLEPLILGAQVKINALFTIIVLVLG
ncbi:MAG: AI-2E family transporter, partial [Deinococcales bacterium]|nr:AI-2E family transporter [Chitinophagaceae bacterium]